MTDSILDQIINTQKQSALDGFEPDKLLSDLLQILDEREREVLDLRYGFTDNDRHTLEDIGRKFSITRERVRQIESAAVDKIKKSESFLDKQDGVFSLIEQTLDEVGGIMSEQKLYEKLSKIAGGEKFEAAIQFLMEKLMADRFILIRANEKMVKSWATKVATVADYEEVIDTISDILKTINSILTLEDLHQHLSSHENHKHKDNLDKNIFENIMHAAADFEKNPFNHWGYKHWPLIKPKRMNDKIYLVLKNHQKPLHFTEIAEKINETNFDHKKAHPATVHNELILDNDRYVLIGRGIYALKEWGYKAGVVTDIIKDIIKENGPMKKDEVIAEVLKQRVVKKSTISLMLANKKLFTKLSDGRYDLAK